MAPNRSWAVCDDTKTKGKRVLALGIAPHAEALGEGGWSKMC